MPEAKHIKIAVVGSLNMDYSVMLDKRPVAGETILANDVLITSGRKRRQSGVCRREDWRQRPDDWQGRR